MKFLILLVSAFAAAACFPDLQASVKDALGTSFIGQNGQSVSLDSLQGKYIGIYFSASWCGPCRRFTPVLSSMYTKLQSQGNFEIIWASKDRSSSSSDAYFTHMPWLRLPFNDRRSRTLFSLFRGKYIPQLVILDPNFNIVTYNARSSVERDSSGNNFPWKY